MVYLSKEEVFQNYDEAVRHSNEWFKPFNEYERIAGNKLSKTLGKNMPRVNDGSLAASLIETPMQVLPTMQNGKFTSLTRKEAWLNEIANIIWRTKIVPNANTQASFFDKEQIALYRALKYGAQPRYNFFVSNENYTGSDWSLPYIKNVKLEPGKFSVDDCDYIYMDVFYTKLALKKIIALQEKEIKDAKKEGREPNTQWNIKALKQLVDMALTSKEIDEQNANEREKSVNASGIKLTACFQRGIGAPFTMFSKQLEQNDTVRDWKNDDPTGDLPITMQYCYENLESPYAVGRVELAGPTQNVLDYMTQAHVLATQIGLQPPKKIKGPTDNANLNSMVWLPDALWQLGNADVEVMQNTNSVYTQFPNNFGLYKAQLQNLQGRTDGSVSSQSGDPGFSKTQAGVKMQETRTNAQDNYLRSKADTASARMAQKMMNVHMSKMRGADILDIAEDDRERLEKAGYFDDNPKTIKTPSLNEIPIIYEKLKSTWKFEYDPRPETDEDEKARWVELIDIFSSNPNLDASMQADGWKFNLGEAFKKVVGASGADGWDKVLTQLTPEEMQNTEAQIDPETGLPIEQPIEEDVAVDQPVEQEPVNQEQLKEELAVTMEEYQIPADAAMAVMQARRQGFEEEEIVEYLRGGNNG